MSPQCRSTRPHHLVGRPGVWACFWVRASGPAKRQRLFVAPPHRLQMQARRALAELKTYCLCPLSVNWQLQSGRTVSPRRQTKAVRSIQLVGLVTTLALVACGGVPRQGAEPLRAGGENQGSAPPSEPTSSLGGAPFLTMVIKPGYNPSQLGRRIAGPSATVQLAPQMPQENMPVGILRTTYRVTLQPGDDCEALTRARLEPGVRWAYLGTFPGQFPDC